MDLYRVGYNLTLRNCNNCPLDHRKVSIGVLHLPAPCHQSTLQSIDQAVFNIIKCHKIQFNVDKCNVHWTSLSPITIINGYNSRWSILTICVGVVINSQVEFFELVCNIFIIFILTSHQIFCCLRHLAFQIIRLNFHIIATI